MGDPERGTAWEESILLSPPRIQFVCLSATVPNLDELADWIREAHGDLTTILHEHRAVPLEHRYLWTARRDVVIDAEGRRRASFKGIGGELARGSPARRWRRAGRTGALGRRRRAGGLRGDERASRRQAPAAPPARALGGHARPGARAADAQPSTSCSVAGACEEAAESCIALGTVPHGADLVREAKQRLADLSPADRALRQIGLLLPLAAARRRRPPRRAAAGGQDAGRGAVPGRAGCAPSSPPTRSRSASTCRPGPSSSARCRSGTAASTAC